jgi:acyl dehydratase
VKQNFIFKNVSTYLTGLGGNRVDNIFAVASLNVRFLGLVLTGICIRTSCTHLPKEQIEVRECLLSFGAETFVFQVAIEKFKD